MCRDSFIVCPVCGAEYLTEEIMFPDNMYGKPMNIIKDECGKILSFDGNSISLNESYKCDKCETSFRVKGTITYKTYVSVDDDFDDTYRTEFKRVTLSED